MLCKTIQIEVKIIFKIFLFARFYHWSLKLHWLKTFC